MKLYNAMEESYLKENLIHKWVTNIVRQNDGYEFLLDDEVYLPVYKYALKITKRKTVKLNLVEEKVLQIVSIGVHQVDEIAKILGIAYPTYSIGLNVGTTGLFYAANEIGIILGILDIFLFCNMFLKKVESKKDMILYIISMFLYIFSILEMGTKVPILAFAGIFAIVFILCVIKMIGMIFIVLIIGICVPYTAVGSNIERNYGVKFLKVFDIKFKQSGNNVKPNQEEKKFNSKEEVTTAVVSGRNLFLKNNMQEYNNGNIMNKAVGIGYADKNEHGYFDRKTVEIDFCDIFFLQGILGCILFFIPIIIIIGMIIKKFFVKFKKSILDEDIISMITALALCIFVALFAGHTFVAPAVSIYIAIILARLNNDLEKKEKL